MGQASPVVTITDILVAIVHTSCFGQALPVIVSWKVGHLQDETHNSMQKCRFSDQIPAGSLFISYSNSLRGLLRDCTFSLLVDLELTVDGVCKYTVSNSHIKGFEIIV